MSWFSAFRGEFGYTYYGEKRTPVTVDVQLVAVVYACVLISIATLIAAAGIRGKERWYTLLRVVFTLTVGSSILLCLYGFCWQTAYIDITSPYIYRSDLLVNGRIGIHIGLQKINITLTGVFEDARNEVNYNEEIALQKFPGPVGEITHCLKRGLPQPVLNVVEYLSVDAGNLRWGRDYTMAGYFARILLWTAFSFWVLGNIIICSVVFYGAFMVTLTGICMVLSTVVFHVLQPKSPVRMSSADISMDMTYGMCFWVILLFGIVTITIGIILLALDHAVPKTMNKYLLLDTQFVKEEVFTSQMRRSSLLPYTQQNNFRRASAPVTASLNKSHSVSEIVQSNPVFDENEELETHNHGNLKRSSTSPGSIHVTCSYDKMHVTKGSHKTSTTSLHSIHEFDEDARSVDTSEGTENLSYVPEESTGKMADSGHSEMTSGHSQMTSASLASVVVNEEENLNRLKNTYIDMEPSHRNDSVKVVS